MPQMFGVTNRALPSATADTVEQTLRVGRYGEQYQIPIGNSYYGLVEEGSIFSAINPTISTGIAASIQTTFSATNGLLSLRNNAGANGVRIQPMSLRIIPTVLPASTTRVECAIAIDSIVRYSSGGTQITALPNVNMDSARTSAAVLHFGALTLAAASANVRYISRFQLSSVIPILFEEYYILFGCLGGDAGTLGGTTARRVTVSAPPVCLGPNANHTMTLHMWVPGNAATAGQYEFELNWIER
jgi:hypothetical protein